MNDAEELDYLLEEIAELESMVKELRDGNMESEKMEEEIEVKTDVKIASPIGDVTFDMKEILSAKKAAEATISKPKLNLMRRKVREFLEGEDYPDYKYWPSRLGSLMKLHLDQFFHETEVVKEFELESGIETCAVYGTTETFDGNYSRFIQRGARFIEKDGEKIVILLSVDRDGDERITIVSAEKGRGIELIKELEDSFYKDGILKNQFFDMEFNFIRRDVDILEKIAWNQDVKLKLEKDVLKFIDILPILREKKLPCSRGVILSGPPGTGKTMMCKAIAGQANITTMLISSEFIKQRSDIKNAFRTARRLAPTLLIIEDVDAAGTVSRAYSDHPLLGEYLQSLDGMEENNGVIVLATTNHTENMDPALTDRPGRFDRIIEVQTPDSEMRSKIYENLLDRVPCNRISAEFKKTLVRQSDGLTGAWMREVVQSALIEAAMDGREKVRESDLKSSISDVLDRRGLAYKSTPNLGYSRGLRDAEASYMG